MCCVEFVFNTLQKKHVFLTVLMLAMVIMHPIFPLCANCSVLSKTSFSVSVVHSHIILDAHISFIVFLPLIFSCICTFLHHKREFNHRHVVVFSMKVGIWNTGLWTSVIYNLCTNTSLGNPMFVWLICGSRLLTLHPLLEICATYLLDRSRQQSTVYIRSGIIKLWILIGIIFVYDLIRISWTIRLVIMATNRDSWVTWCSIG